MATAKLPPVPYDGPIVDERAGGRITHHWQRWLNTLKDRVDGSVASEAGTIDASQIASGTVDEDRLPALNINIEFDDADFEHQLLDSTHHTDTITGAPINGDTIVAQGTAWKRLPVGAADAILRVVAGLPTWSTIVDACVSAAAAIAWSKISKVGSSLADLATRSAADLSSGTLADARLSANVPLVTVLSYTAAFSAGITVGNGTMISTAYRIGKQVFFELTFTFGSTSAVTGTPVLNFPTTLPSAWNGHFFGNVAFSDATGEVWVGAALISSTTTFFLRRFAVSGVSTFADGITSTVPFTWTTGDSIHVVGNYTEA